MSAATPTARRRAPRALASTVALPSRSRLGPAAILLALLLLTPTAPVRALEMPAASPTADEPAATVDDGDDADETAPSAAAPDEAPTAGLPPDAPAVLDGPLRPKGTLPPRAETADGQDQWRRSFEGGLRWKKGDTSVTVSGAPFSSVRIGGTISR